VAWTTLLYSKHLGGSLEEVCELGEMLGIELEEVVIKMGVKGYEEKIKVTWHLWDSRD